MIWVDSRITISTSANLNMSDRSNRVILQSIRIQSVDVVAGRDRFDVYGLQLYSTQNYTSLVFTLTTTLLLLLLDRHEIYFSQILTSLYCGLYGSNKSLANLRVKSKCGNEWSKSVSHQLLYAPTLITFILLK